MSEKFTGDMNEPAQVNFRVPRWSVLAYQLLAEQRGLTVPQFCKTIADEAVRDSLLGTGRENFIAEIKKEHAEELTFWEETFDRLETN